MFAPSGLRSKFKANVAALRTMQAIDAAGRPATAAERETLRQWASWGAIPKVFDESAADWAVERAELRSLLTPAAWDTSRRSVINAHFTSATVVQAMWDAVVDLGFDGGWVLEPGCGSGRFIDMAPALPAYFVGVELDPTTARIAQLLHPEAEILAEGFEKTRRPMGWFDLAIGNVPFGPIVLHDPLDNKSRRSMHNHFILKALRRVKPDGLVALLTSRWTLDAKDSGARAEMAELGDLIGAVRLPSGSHRLAAGTDAIMDLLIFRRLADGQTGRDDWMSVVPIETADGSVEINEYFAVHRNLVLGTVGAKNGQYSATDMVVTAGSVPLAEALPAALRSITGQPPRLTVVRDERTSNEPASSLEVPPATPTTVAPSPACGQCGADPSGCWCFIEVPDPLPADVSADGLGLEPHPDEQALDLGLAPVEPAPPARAPRPKLPKLPEPLPVAEDQTDLHQEGSILRAKGGGFVRLFDGVVSRFPVGKTAADELTILLDLRDTVLAILRAQASSTDDSEFLGLQADLNARYDAYVGRYGPLNRFTTSRTGVTLHQCLTCQHEWRVPSKAANPTVCDGGSKKSLAGNPQGCGAAHEDVGVECMKRNYPNMGGFRSDPAFWTVMALEIFDPETQTASKADIFSKRVVEPRATRTHADSAQDAIAISLNEHGRLDIDVIADLLSMSTADARDLIGSLVWDDPKTGDLVPAATYLSGNVRQKLATARRYARSDARFEAHVEALEAVQPPDLTSDEIDARPGAPWIPVDDVVAFMQATLFEPGAYNDLRVEYARITATWEVRCSNYYRHGVRMTSEWGTRRADALDLFHDSLNQRSVEIFDTQVYWDDEGKRRERKILNVDETLVAKEKQAALADRFRAWIWEDPERAERTARVYNDLFNSWVLPTYDGSHLTTPGRATSFTPHPHQLDAVWRILQSPATLLAHEVGSGKTAIMGMASMEMRRLGLVRKPCVVVPNHMLAQVAGELLQLYPLANILVPTKADVEKKGRKRFLARCAMGDWDLVILTHSAFTTIAVHPETAQEFVDMKVAALERAITESKEEGEGLSVKKLEVAKLRLEQRQEKLLAAENKDDGVSFDDSGIDYIFYDESQAVKNLYVASKQGIGGRFSQRAADVEMKLWYLRRKHGARVATFSTATPIANSIAEMFVVQTYLQPEVLEAAGIESFDGWAATFGSSVTALELAPDGASYRMNTRACARFHNVPELVGMFRLTADVKGNEDIKLKGLPGIAGGRAENVIVKPSDQLVDYVEDLVERARLIRQRTPRMILNEYGDELYEDMMLLVCTDGRKAALDTRLVGLPAPDNGGKAAAAAERIHKHWLETRDNVYTEPNGRESPVRGAFQLVFCDLGTPKDGRWTVYADLKQRLVDKGMPEERIRFIHEAKDAAAKAEMFAACRSGRVSVLIGSTEKMGIGTNVQARLVAMHHLDCPWRPDQIAQRDGRGIRQGNQNKLVHIYRYAVEGSFDVYMWQTCERKASFIFQVMRGKITAREIDDVGDMALSYGEMKAAASGNPLIMEKAGVDMEHAKLLRLRRSHDDDQARLTYRIKEAGLHRPRLLDRVAALTAAIERRVDVSGERFAITLGTETHTKRKEVAPLLHQAVIDVIGAGAMGVPRTIGTYAGFDLVVTCDRKREQVVVRLDLAGSTASKEYTRIEMHQATGMGLLSTLSHMVQTLDEKLYGCEQAVALLDQEVERAAERIGAPFPDADRLAFLTKRQAEINESLKQMEEKAA